MADPGAGWPDIAGRIAGEGHVLPVRVYFEDTDFSGLVYHASYLRWCERGRSDFLRLLGVHHSDLFAPETGEPAAFVVRRMEIDFLRPARIDDVLEVHTAVNELKAASLTLDQLILSGPQRLFRAQVQVVLLARSGKPQRLGPRLRRALGHDPEGDWEAGN